MGLLHKATEIQQGRGSNIAANNQSSSNCMVAPRGQSQGTNIGSHHIVVVPQKNSNNTSQSRHNVGPTNPKPQTSEAIIKCFK